MSPGAALLSLVIVHLAANASPGPNTLLVTQVAAAQTRAAAMRVALGLTLGATMWAIAATLSVGLLQQLEPLQHAMRLLGGGYLIWLGVRMALNGAGPPARARRAIPSSWRLVRSGLATNLANPASLMFFVGVFAALLPTDGAPALRAAAVLLVAVDALLWYALLAFVFSTARAQRAYSGFKRRLEFVLGGLVTLFGLRLVWSAR